MQRYDYLLYISFFANKGWIGYLEIKKKLKSLLGKKQH